MRKIKKKPTHKHFQLSWDVLDAVRIVEDFEAVHGACPKLPYSVLKRIYTGDMFDAIWHKKIPSVQRYGVIYNTLMLDPDKNTIAVEHAIKLSEDMKLSEFFNGYANCYVNQGHGLKTKGWKGAKDFWLDCITKEYPDHTVISARATANCLAKI